MPAVAAPQRHPASGRPRSLREVVQWSRQVGDLAGLLREFLDEFYSARTSADRQEMLADDPSLTHNPRTDAYVAAVAEHLAGRYRISVPSWTWRPERFLARPYFPSGLESLKATLLAQSPAAFRRRMIFVDADPLYRPRRDARGIGEETQARVAPGHAREG